MIKIKVTFNNGDYLFTKINLILKKAKEYYINNCFNLGIVKDKIVKGIKVEEVI